VGYSGYSHPTPCGTARRVRCGAAGREPRCAGTQEGTRHCARTDMLTRVEPTTLTLPVPRSKIPTSPPPLPACTPHAAQSSRRRPPKGQPAVLHCAVSTKHRGGHAGRVLRVLAAHAVRHCAAHRWSGAAGREPRCAGTREGTQQCARTVMFVRFEPTTLTWPVEPEEIPTSPPLLPACTPHAAQSSRRRPPKGLAGGTPTAL
jgi:hypothetical protein